MSEPIVLSLVEPSISVTLSDKEGKIHEYTLREMVASDRDSFMDAYRLRFDRDEKGDPKGIKRFQDIQAELVTRCLFDTANKKVPTSTIQSWPSNVVNALHSAAEKLNRLTEKTDETQESLVKKE